MILWISFAVLAATVTALVASPLLSRSRRQAASAEASDVAVYRDQLAEIQHERARGVIEDDEADGARTEVARRLLMRADAGARMASADKTKTAISEVARKGALLAIVAVLPLASLGVYLLNGSPELPSRPYAERINAPLKDMRQAEVGDLVAMVEARLRAKPDDAQGWDVIAPIYLRLGEFSKAAEAFSQALTLLGESPKRLSGFAEASIRAADGIVSEPARKAAERLIALEPKRVEPRLWLSIAKQQNGDLAGAAESLRSALKDAAPDPAWREAIEHRLAALDRQLAGPATPATPAAGEITAEPMVEAMVARLAERLKTDHDDLPGWLKLVRSYSVLGRKEDAVAALTTARTNFNGNAEALAALAALAKDLGLGS